MQRDLEKKKCCKERGEFHQSDGILLFCFGIMMLFLRVFFVKKAKIPINILKQLQLLAWCIRNLRFGAIEQFNIAKLLVSDAHDANFSKLR